MSDEPALAPGLRESALRLSATLLAIVRTRLAILSNDLEVEKATLLKISLLSVVSVFFLGVGLILLTLLVVIGFWEAHRLSALAALTALYGAVGMGATLYLRRTIQRRNALLSHTLAELSRDQQALAVGDDR